MSRRQRNKLHTRSRILSAATELFATQGVANTTTRQIAERAGQSYQTLYNYFPTKSRLVHGLLGTDMADWSLQVDDLIKRSEGDVLLTISQIFQQRIQLITQDEQTHQLWHTVATGRSAREFNQQEHIMTLNAVAHEQFYTLLSLTQGMGRISHSLDLHLMAHTLFSLTDYALSQFYLGDIDAETFLRTQQEQIALVLTPYLTTPLP